MKVAPRRITVLLILLPSLGYEAQADGFFDGKLTNEFLFMSLVADQPRYLRPSDAWT